MQNLVISLHYLLMSVISNYTQMLCCLSLIKCQVHISEHEIRVSSCLVLHAAEGKEQASYMPKIPPLSPPLSLFLGSSFLRSLSFPPFFHVSRLTSGILDARRSCERIKLSYSFYRVNRSNAVTYPLNFIRVTICDKKEIMIH